MIGRLRIPVAGSGHGDPEWDFSHTGTASTVIRTVRTGRNRMKPGIHYARAW
jgi:hypothetical protein